MYKIFRICSAAFLAAAVGVGAAIADPAVNDHVITSTRMGPVSLGMTMTQLRAAMPPPNRSSAVSNNIIEAIWLDPAFHVRVRTDTDAACSMTAWDDAYATEGGLKVGQTQFDMRAVLGKPDSLVFNRYPNQWDATYPDLNLYVEGVSDTGIIIALTVGACPYI